MYEEPLDFQCQYKGNTEKCQRQIYCKKWFQVFMLKYRKYRDRYLNHCKILKFAKF